MARSIGAIAAGLVVVGIVVAGIQYATSLLYPLPEGLDPFDPASGEALRAHAEGLPTTAWLLAFGSEIIGVFLGALAAGTVAGSRKSMFAGIIVAVGVVGSVMNWVSFAHPLWYIVGQLVGYPLIFFAVSRVLAGRRGA